MMARFGRECDCPRLVGFPAQQLDAIPGEGSGSGGDTAAPAGPLTSSSASPLRLRCSGAVRGYWRRQGQRIESPWGRLTTGPSAVAADADAPPVSAVAADAAVPPVEVHLFC